MIPYTISIYEDCWHIDQCIPITRYKNREWFLPDGRRLMAGNLKKGSGWLETRPAGFEMSHDVHAEIVYPMVTFREGKQPWVSLSEVGTRDTNILLYVTAELAPPGAATPYTLETGYSQISWLLPFQESYAGSKSSHGGLAVLKPGQALRLNVVTPNSEIKIIRVIATQHAGRPQLGYAI